MRKIEMQACYAFSHALKFKSGNTETRVANGFSQLLLHGSVIAQQNLVDGALAITLAGYPTRTTRSRLNALLAHLGYTHGIGQRMGTPWIGDTVLNPTDVVMVHPDRVEILEH